MNQVRFSEDIVEQAALAWFENLDYELIQVPNIAPEGQAQERPSYEDIILEERLRSALAIINPKISAETLNEVCRKVISSKAPDLFEDNLLFHRMLVDGVDVEYTREDGSIAGDKILLIDFEQTYTTTPLQLLINLQ